MPTSRDQNPGKRDEAKRINENPWLGRKKNQHQRRPKAKGPTVRSGGKKLSNSRKGTGREKGVLDITFKASAKRGNAEITPQINNLR